MSDTHALVRRVDECLSAIRLSSTADVRILEAIERERHRDRGTRLLWPALAFVCGALATLAFASRADIDVPVHDPSTLTAEADDAVVIEASEPARVVDDDCVRTRDGAALVLRGHCRERFDAPALEVETWRVAELVVEPDGLRLRSGWATFEVAAVVGTEPVRVWVSGGAIEVLGTRFTVFEGPASGHVDLLEGRIRFVDHEGAIVEIVEGQRLHWDRTPVVSVGPTATPLNAASVPESSLPAHRVPPGARTKQSEDQPRVASELPLESIARLRAAKRYEDALALIRGLALDGIDVRTAEALNYEAGTILDDHLGRVDEACAHWTAHLRLYPNGRYVDSIRDRMAARSCEEP